MVQLSMSTIDHMEKNGEFPKIWYITNKRCVWTQEEVEEWLDERWVASSEEFDGKKPPVD